MPAILFFLFTIVANAQEGIGYLDHGGMDVSFSAGKFLPFNIDGLTNTYSMWGVRLSHPSAVARFEYEWMNFNAHGARLDSLSASVRIDFRMAEVMEGFFSFGPDFYMYEPESTATQSYSRKMAGGGHFGFGGYWEFDPRFALRADFKMNYNPGKSLYSGFGFIYRFGKSKDGAP